MKRLSLVLLATISLFATMTHAAVPPAPDYVKVAWIDNLDQFLVRWSPVQSATGYNVYRYDTNTTGWVQIAANLTVNPWNVPLLRDPATPDAVPATYAVTAVNDDGEGPLASGSVVPEPDVGNYFTTYQDWWPVGYTFIYPQFVGADLGGTDGMMEFGLDRSNYTHAAWNTNIQQGHQLHITNLVSGTGYYAQLTAVDENGRGVTFMLPWPTYTLPAVPIVVQEDLPNEIDIGTYTWIERAQIYTPPAHGTLVPYEGLNQRWIYTPNPDFTGIDTFQILDNPSGPPVTLTLNVQNVNDPPVPQPLTVYVAEDSTNLITPVVYDIENDPYTVWAWDYPANGFLFSQGTNFVYIPNTDFVGTDSFTFFAMDEQWIGTVSGVIIVTNVNDQAVVVNQFFETSEDTAITFNLDATDIDGDTLTLQIIDPPMHGSLTNNGLSVTYTPNANYYGSDHFTYRVSDGQTNSELSNVDFNITPVNDPPTAQALSVTTPEDTSIVLPFAGSDPDLDGLTFEVVDAPQHGTALGDFYLPDADYQGSDSLTYRAWDGNTYSAPATITITVTPVNDPPVADSKAVSVNEDQSVAIALTGSDVDGDSLSFIVLNPPSHGVFADGVYTPAANYFGSDSFTYTANDGQADSAAATVTITINALNDAPIANSQSVTTPYNTSLDIVLTGGDVEGNALTFTATSSPANGTLTGTGATRTFTPNIGWAGTTSFTFVVYDGELDSATATVTITVASPGSAPAAPTALTATAVSPSQINLAWNDDSTNEDGFKIERATASAGPWTQIATVGPGVTTYASTGLSKNKRYYYRVRAYNVLGNSAYSNTANARTLN